MTDSPKPTAYWNKVAKNLKKESQFYPFWIKLKMKGVDGKLYKTDSANTEGVLRIAMSVPSPKAEPLKLWLAQVGKERIEENKGAAVKGGNIAAVARQNVERLRGEKVVSPSNFLGLNTNETPKSELPSGEE